MTIRYTETFAHPLDHKAKKKLDVFLLFRMNDYYSNDSKPLSSVRILPT